MEVALRVAGIGPGDEVITTPISWVATANVVVAVGARPVFVDIDPRTRNIDLAALEAAITPRTRALMPVYLAGLPVDMDRLYAIAARHGLRVIEDAAQAIDSRWRGRRIGAFGDLVSFSFQANKNITCAEGGCLVLADEAEARVAERLRLQGVVRSGADGMDVVTPGGKFNLSDIHATIGLHQLPALDRDHAAPRRARRRVLRGRARRRAGGARHRAAACRPMPPRRRPTGTCSRSSCPPIASTAAAPRSWRRCARRASAPASTIRRCTCSASTARSAGAKACCRSPSGSAAAS